MASNINLPLLSIVTVNYNSGNGLDSTINSLMPLLIEEDRVEYIVIDADSTDNSLSSISEDKIILISKLVCEKDFGIYDAMNKGIKIASGEWIWFLNSGDISLMSGSFVKNNLEKTSEDINLLYSDFVTNENIVVNQILSKKFLLYGMINHQSIIYRKSILKCYNLSYGLGADFANLINIFDIVHTKKIITPIVIYDLNGVSSKNTRLIKVKIWYQRSRAFKNSNMPLVYKVVGIFISFLILFLKLLFPNLRLKNYLIK